MDDSILELIKNAPLGLPGVILSVGGLSLMVILGFRVVIRVDINRFMENCSSCRKGNHLWSIGDPKFCEKCGMTPRRYR